MPMPDASALLFLNLFGSMEAANGFGQSILPRVRKTRAMLAILALSAPEAVSRSTLCSLLWAQREQEQARASLRQSLRELNVALEPLGGDLLTNDRDRIALSKDKISLDADLVLQEACSLSDAAKMLRGRLLEDFDGLNPVLDAWLAERRNTMSATMVKLFDNRMRMDSDPEGAAAAAERLVRIDRTQEGAWRLLMEAHALRGDPPEAIATYRRCAASLAAAGAGEPSSMTRALLKRIETAASSHEAVPAAAVSLTEAPAAQKRLRLGVMPFRALDAGGSELALGLAEEITAGLSRFRWLSCVSSFSLAALSNQGDQKQAPAWATLALDFLLEGSVQRGTDRVRVRVSLLDMRRGGEVVWAQRFDKALTDVLSMQEEIAAQTVAQVDPELLVQEGGRAGTHDVVNPTAYLKLMRAIPTVCRLDATEFPVAGELLASAVALDPEHAAAHAWWAYWHLLLVGQGWAQDAGVATARCWELTQRAIQLDPSDARALTVAGHVQAFLHRDLEGALALHERALAANPNLPLAWAFSGLAHIYAGRPDEGTRRIGQARSLSPFDPHGFFFDAGFMLSHLVRAEDEEVVRIGRGAIQLNQSFSSLRKVQLAALGHLGRGDEAVRMRTELLRLEPDFTVAEALRRSPLVRAQDRDRYAAGLRLAGLAP